MRNGLGERLLGLLLAALMLLCALPCALADEYDKDHPEILEEGHLSAVSAILIDADSGDVIFYKHPDEKMFPASTTKILTVWLALTKAELIFPDGLQHKVIVSDYAVDLAADESSAKLRAGEFVSLIDLCYAAMLASGNDAATAIAEGMAGSVAAFAEWMNDAAWSLGCSASHFVNANGLHDDDHYTTARDLAIITKIAMENPTFRTIVKCAEYELPPQNNRKHVVTNGNNFVVPREGKESRYYTGATGVKTGTTSAAGNCLVASAGKNGINLISVVLGCPSDAVRYTDSKKLMDYGFAQFKSVTIADIYAQNPRVVDIRGFDLNDPDLGRLELSLRKVSTDGSDRVVTTQERIDEWVRDFYSITVTKFTRDFNAPVQQGEVMGTLSYYPEEGNPVEYELIASRSIGAREKLALSVEDIIAAAENDPNPFPRITLELVTLYLLLPLLAIFLVIRLIIALVRFIKKRRKMRAYKPTSRYYR